MNRLTRLSKRKRSSRKKKISESTDPARWRTFFDILRTEMRQYELPSVSLIAATDRDPFKILVSTMISLRTKDEVTLASSRRLFSAASSASELALLPPDEIAALIFPAGFYRTKAAHISQVSRILVEQYGGAVPDTLEQLTALPGVGLKTANLTLGLGFNIPAICVDTHVHRIANRLGWLGTDTPEQTEARLREILPRNYWIEINSLFVIFGQRLCMPLSPRCSDCPFGTGAAVSRRGLAESCPRLGVRSSR